MIELNNSTNRKVMLLISLRREYESDSPQAQLPHCNMSLALLTLSFQITICVWLSWGSASTLQYVSDSPEAQLPHWFFLEYLTSRGSQEFRLTPDKFQYSVTSTTGLAFKRTLTEASKIIKVRHLYNYYYKKRQYISYVLLLRLLSSSITEASGLSHVASCLKGVYIRKGKFHSVRIQKM